MTLDVQDFSEEERESLNDAARDVAVLLIAFNRPDLLRRQIGALKEFRPHKIYIAVDGPRNESESHRVEATRQSCASIDWDCEVHTLFRERNIGCRFGPSTAMDWFFEHEERGVILEDDILPTVGFFLFCYLMLERYQSNPLILSICGSNFVPEQNQRSTYSYRFSRYAHVWGWATWRDRWQQFEGDLGDWRIRFPVRELRRRVSGSRTEAAYLARIFDAVAYHGMDAWDAQFEFLSMSNGYLTILPAQSLVENVGFEDDATHTFRRPPYLQSAEPLRLPIIHPPVERDEESDAWEHRHVFGATPMGIARKLLRRSRNLLR